MPNENPVLHKKHVARLQREQQQSKIILYTFIGILAAVLLLVLYGSPSSSRRVYVYSASSYWPSIKPILSMHSSVLM